MFKVDHDGWIPVPSPNFNARPKGVEVSALIYHFTAAGTAKATADYFAKREVSWTENGVKKTAKVAASSHVVIARDGLVYQCVHLDDRAWHAGKCSTWLGKPTNLDINNFSVGVEVANWGELTRKPDGSFVNYLNKPYKGEPPVQDVEGKWWEPYSEAQVQACIEVGKVFVALFPAITRERTTGHQDIAPERKRDPGPAWPWARVLDGIFGPAKDPEENKRAGARLKGVPVAESPKTTHTAPGEDQMAYDTPEEVAAAADMERAHYDEEAEMCLVEPET